MAAHRRSGAMQQYLLVELYLYIETMATMYCGPLEREMILSCYHNTE